MNTTPTHPEHPERPLSIAVVGAGAVGCYFGALLARAGHSVVLIGRAAHVDAIQRQGLHLQTAQEDAFIPLRASTQMDAVAGADVVLLCVKSTDTETATREMAAHLAPGATILTLQNGVDNDVRVRAILGAAHPVLACAVYVATAMAGPGHVQHFGRGDLVLADSPHSGALAQQFAAAGIAVQISPRVQEALWAKLVINCAYNALSAITGQPYGVLMAQAGVVDVIGDIMAECQAVAQADGVTLPQDMAAMVAAIARTMPGQLSSTAQDMARGRLTEIEHLNGYVVRRGAALGLATPVNRSLLVLVQLLQNTAKNTHGLPQSPPYATQT